MLGSQGGDDLEWLETTVRQESRAAPVPTLLREEIGRRGERAAKVMLLYLYLSGRGDRMRPSGNGWVGLLRHQRSVRLGRARMSSLALSACSLSMTADLAVVVVGTLPEGSSITTRVRRKGRGGFSPSPIC